MSTRRLVVVGLGVAFLIAGGLSLYASGHPDGLDFVARSLGFADDARSSDAPLAGYRVPGVSDPQLASGLAGVLGALTVLGVMTGLIGLLRRKRSR